MLSNPTHILIPARLASTRLPKKLLISIADLPVIEHVRRRAVAASSDQQVIVCSPDQEILEVIESFGGQVFKSRGEYSNGTLRCLECAQHLKLSSFVLLQGDEILLSPDHIQQMVQTHLLNSSKRLINSVSPIYSESSLHTESVVKALSLDGSSINYLFRKSPFKSSFTTVQKLLFKLNGLMSVYTDQLLRSAAHFDSSFVLEEKIEQLAYLSAGISLELLSFTSPGPSLDTPQDLEVINTILSSCSKQRELVSSYQYN